MTPFVNTRPPQPTYAEMLRMNRKFLLRLVKGTLILCLAALPWAGLYAMVPA